jgi:hypothetical protein
VLDGLDVPPIIHSTFLRFRSPPRTDGASMQERFQADVVSVLGELLPHPFRVPVATLVCERTPYMHVPFDDRHVLATICFTEDESVADRMATDANVALDRIHSLRIADR